MIKYLAILVNILLTFTIHSQDLNQEFFGETPGESLGMEVALSNNGNQVVLTAPWSDYNGENSGKVIVAEYQDNVWRTIGTPIYGPFHHVTGYKIALSGNGRVIALSDWNVWEENIWIFQYDGNDWVSIGTISQDWQGCAQPGSEIDLDFTGNRIILGVPKFTSSCTQETKGMANVFQYDGSNWVQLGENLVGQNAGDEFGSAVSISNNGSRVAIGGPNNGSTNKGHVKVFDYINGHWVQLGSDILGEEPDGQFGTSVLLSATGEKLVIGAPFEDNDPYPNAGSVRLFEFTNETWLQISTPVKGKWGEAKFGSSIDISADGSLLTVGNSLDLMDGKSVGSVEFFKLNSHQWFPFGSKIYGVENDEQFGFDLSMNSVGNRIAISSPTYSTGTSLNLGAVRIYDMPLLIDIFSCDSFLSPSGNHIWTESGIYNDTLQSSTGDSTILINLTILDAKIETFNNKSLISLQSGDNYSFQWLDCNDEYAPIPGAVNRVFAPTLNGIYAVKLTRGNCVDTSDCKLFGGIPFFQDIDTFACNYLPSPSGSYIWTNSGNYHDTLQSPSGDTILNINLTILDAEVEIQNDAALFCIQEGNSFSYQWLDCNNKYTPISEAINQTFTPTLHGTYAVQLTRENCVDTSNCLLFETISSSQNIASTKERISFHPNPTSENILVDLGRLTNNVNINICNNIGQVILSKRYKFQQLIDLNIEGPFGVYFITVQGEELPKTILKVIKHK